MSYPKVKILKYWMINDYLIMRTSMTLCWTMFFLNLNFFFLLCRRLWTLLAGPTRLLRSQRRGSECCRSRGSRRRRLRCCRAQCPDARYRWRQSESSWDLGKGDIILRNGDKPPPTPSLPSATIFHKILLILPSYSEEFQDRNSSFQLRRSQASTSRKAAL